MNALIVDDEPLARVHLRRLLEGQSVIVVGEADEASIALAQAESLRPDLLFLDIEMPGLSGMQMAAALIQLDFPPLLVFVTGYSEHAVAAFEHDAVDYLVKPVSPERLARTLVRARARLVSRRAASVTREHMQEARAALADRAADAGTSTLQRLPVRTDYTVLLVRVEEICRAQARDKRVYIRTRDAEEHRTYYTLTQLEKMLPHDQFIRVHDSFVVNLSYVEELLFLGNHAYEVRLASDERVPVGRSYYAELRRRLGLNTAGTGI